MKLLWIGGIKSACYSGLPIHEKSCYFSWKTLLAFGAKAVEIYVGVIVLEINKSG